MGKNKTGFMKRTYKVWWTYQSHVIRRSALLGLGRHGIAVPYINQPWWLAITGLKSVSKQWGEFVVDMPRHVAGMGRVRGMHAKQVSPRLPPRVLTVQS